MKRLRHKLHQKTLELDSSGLLKLTDESEMRGAVGSDLRATGWERGTTALPHMDRRYLGTANWSCRMSDPTEGMRYDLADLIGDDGHCARAIKRSRGSLVHHRGDVSLER